MSPRTKAHLLLLVTSMIWGVAGPVIRHTVILIPPSIFLVYRFALSTVVALIIFALTKPRIPSALSSRVWIFIYCFLTTTVSLGLLFLGYEKTSAITGSVINAIYPLTVSAVGVALLHEKVTRREVLGMSIGILGSLLVVFEPFINGQPVHAGDFTGNLLILASLGVGVVLAVMAKLIMRKISIDASTLTNLSFIIGLVTILPVVLTQFSWSAIQTAIVSAPLSAHLGVWYMALLSGTVAYALWHRAQKTIEIGETAIYSYLYPVFTLPLSIWWLNEPTTPMLIVGTTIIAIGVILAETKKSRVSPFQKRSR